MYPLDPYQKIFSTCRRILGDRTWGRVLAEAGETLSLESFPDLIDQLSKKNGFPGFIAELARLEWVLYLKKESTAPAKNPKESIVVNPTLTLLPVSWTDFSVLIRCEGEPGSIPEKKRAI